MDARTPTLSPPPGHFEQPQPNPRRSRKRLVVGISLGVVGLLALVIAGLVVMMVRLQGQQIALVEDVMATLTAGDPIPEDLVCADPDDVVSGLVEDPQSWPVASYEVLGVSDLSYSSTTSVPQWYVEAVVNDEVWLVEVWDSTAGRMSGICGMRRFPGR